MNNQATIRPTLSEQYLCKQVPVLGNHFNNNVCNKKKTDEWCSLFGHSDTNVQNDDLSLSMSRSYKWEDLLDRSLVSEEITFLVGL
jgi:hypothetical protein